MQETTPTVRDEIRDYVVSRTTRGVGRDDVLFAICEKHDLSWPQAEALVEEILAENAREVSLRSNVVYGGIAFGTLLVGLIIAVESGYRLTTQLTSSPLDSSTATWDLLMAVIAENYPLLIGLLFSAVLLVVGMWGVWHTVGDFFLSLFD